MLFRRIKGDPQARFWVAKCSRCGRPFIKVENRSTLCSYKCLQLNTQDNKAKYQRKRRKLINDGHLISNESNQVGTSTVLLSKNIKPTFEEEHHHILREKRRVGLISQ